MLVLAALLLFAPDPPAAQDPVAARKLLDAVPEMVSAVHQETGIISLYRAGIAMGAIDKKAGLELLSRAFSTDNQDYRAEIVKATATLDLPAAIEMLRQLPKPAPAAIPVIQQLMAAKKVDQALELLAMTPDSAEYPFDAAAHLMARLPSGDPRREITFGRATEAFIRKSEGPFPVFVERFGKQVPPTMLNQAVNAMIQRIETWKDDDKSFNGAPAGEDRKLEYHSPQQVELRELMSVVRHFDSGSADRILKSRPELKAVLAGFKDKRKSPEAINTKDDEPEPDSAPGDDDDDDLSPPLGLGMANSMEDFGKRINEYTALEKQVKKIFETAKKDPSEAMRLTGKLPAAARAEVIARLAGRLADKDAAQAGPQLDNANTAIDELPDPSTRVIPRIIVADSYMKIRDRDRAIAAFRKALSDVLPLWAADTRAERPNVAPRDTWPSIQACRMVSYRAGKALGADAVSLLSDMQVQDLVLVARIHIAQALLGLAPSIHAINVAWSDSK